MGLFGWLKGKLNTNLEDVVQNVTGKTVEEIEAGHAKDVTGDSSDKGTTGKLTTLSPTAKEQLWNKTYNSNKTAYNTLNQTNYFDTSAPIDELQNQLLFYKLSAIKDIG